MKQKSHKFLFFCIFALGCIIGLLILFSKTKRKKYDISLASVDGQNVFIISKATYYEPAQLPKSANEITFENDNPPQLISNLKKRKDFWKTIEVDGESKNPILLFEKNGSFFYLTSNEQDINLHSLRAFYFMDGQGSTLGSHLFVTVLPIENEMTWDWQDGAEYSWDETLGITSFEDLSEFYSRCDENFFSVDKTQQNVTLGAFFGEKWYSDFGIVSVSSNGIKLTVNKTTIDAAILDNNNRHYTNPFN